MFESGVPVPREGQLSWVLVYQNEPRLLRSHTLICSLSQSPLQLDLKPHSLVPKLSILFPWRKAELCTACMCGFFLMNSYKWKENFYVVLFIVCFSSPYSPLLPTLHPCQTVLLVFRYITMMMIHPN